MDEENKDKDTNTSSESENDNAVADIVLHYKNLYEAEVAAREKDRQTIAELSKVIRTIGIQERKTETDISTEDKINKLFGGK